MVQHSKNKKEKRKLVKLFSILLLAIICIVCIINSSHKNKETSSPIESYNTAINSIENIISVKLPSSSDVIDNENSTNNEVVTKKDNTNKTLNTNSNSNTTIKNTPQYYIKVNYGANVVTIYTKDSNGNYSVPVKAMVCSTGADTPKSGVYSIPGRWKWGKLFGNVYGQYCVKITGNILFHSVPYLKNDPSSLEYWEYDKLGTSASAGCVRLTVADVLWIYNNCPNGTKVEFYSSSNPGPLGKPSAQKISENETCRNWDPTDPNPNNPWKNFSTNSSSSNSTSENNNTIVNSSNNIIENNSIAPDSNTTNNNNINDTTNNNAVTDNNIISTDNGIEQNILNNTI